MLEKNQTKINVVYPRLSVPEETPFTAVLQFILFILLYIYFLLLRIIIIFFHIIIIIFFILFISTKAIFPQALCAGRNALHGSTAVRCRGVQGASRHQCRDYRRWRGHQPWPDRR